MLVYLEVGECLFYIIIIYHPFIYLSTYLSIYLSIIYLPPSLPRLLNGKRPACLCRRCGFDPWIGKTFQRRKCNPLRYSCLGNPMDRGAWWATVHEVKKESHTASDACIHLPNYLSTCINIMAMMALYHTYMDLNVLLPLLH